LSWEIIEKTDFPQKAREKANVLAGLQMVAVTWEITP
jgi:hypothetical protein